jgi:hypothetical protein
VWDNKGKILLLYIVSDQTVSGPLHYMLCETKKKEKRA